MIPVGKDTFRCILNLNQHHLYMQEDHEDSGAINNFNTPPISVPYKSKFNLGFSAIFFFSICFCRRKGRISVKIIFLLPFVFSYRKQPFGIFGNKTFSSHFHYCTEFGDTLHNSIYLNKGSSVLWRSWHTAEWQILSQNAVQHDNSHTNLLSL